MVLKYLLLLLFASSNLTCFTNRNLTARKVKAQELNFEGYVVINVTLSTEVSNGTSFQKTTKENDTTISNRRMYLKNNFLIDIVPNDHFDNGKFIKTDTLTYDFYDLANQKYVLFKTLSADAKVVKKGSMSIDGSFSNTSNYDPLNGVVDSIWTLTDTVINGKSHGVINFILTGITDSLDKEFTKRTKFWVDHGTKNFPLQLSYILSKKLDGAFVYKMQQPFHDGNTVMVTCLDYQPTKLPDTLKRVFDKWIQIIRK